MIKRGFPSPHSVLYPLGKIGAGEEEGDREWDSWMAHWLNEHEFEQTPGDGEGQGSLVCWVPGITKRHGLVTQQQPWYLL